MVALDYGAAHLSDPINIRYATDTHTFNVWTRHAPGRYVFVPVSVDVDDELGPHATNTSELRMSTSDRARFIAHLRPPA